MTSLLCLFFQLGGGPGPAQPVGPMGGLGDLFSLSGGPGIPGGMYSAPKQVRLNLLFFLCLPIAITSLAVS